MPFLVKLATGRAVSEMRNALLSDEACGEVCHIRSHRPRSVIAELFKFSLETDGTYQVSERPNFRRSDGVRPAPKFVCFARFDTALRSILGTRSGVSRPSSCASLPGPCPREESGRPFGGYWKPGRVQSLWGRGIRWASNRATCYPPPLRGWSGYFCLPDMKLLVECESFLPVS